MAHFSAFTLDRDWHNKGKKPDYKIGDILQVRNIEWLIDKQAWMLVVEHIGYPVTKVTPIEIELI